MNRETSLEELKQRMEKNIKSLNTKDGVDDAWKLLELNENLVQYRRILAKYYCKK